MEDGLISKSHLRNLLSNFNHQIIQTMTQSKDPLHGKTLEAIVTELVTYYGWEELGQLININCFKSDPSIKSSLTFLRKTDWARKKTESLYLYMLRKKTKVNDTKN